MKNPLLTDSSKSLTSSPNCVGADCTAANGYQDCVAYHSKLPCPTFTDAELFKMKKNKARFVASSAVVIGNPTIGEGTWIGHFTVIDGSQGLTIGKNCSIASGVHIYTHSTHLQTTEGRDKLVGRVEIGDNVAIGANSIILHGCKIGDHVVIPALTLLRPWTEINKVEQQPR